METPMNTKNNQRSRLTKMLLKQAYMALMDEKAAGKITVTDLCEKAEINRSTFYMHYSEPNDVLKELEDDTIESVREAISAIGKVERDPGDAGNYLMTFLRYIKKNEDVFRTFLVENNDPHFRRKLRDVALEIMGTAFRIDISPEVQRAVYLYIVSGCIDVLTDWVRGGFVMSEKNMCTVLYSMSEGSLSKICSLMR